ncbi:asparagine synthase-related protein [Streptomyces aurantiacus]|uniref:asparagine synthase-related protein n=1 Tax=Streptomyces aurantiacus TaxID=47760 RepID=UPI00055A7E14|nr:asparagine synthase-related protein [Streptomyces aurantiacus]
MIKISVSLRDLAGEWTNSGARWSCGASWIEPFVHPLLEVLTATDGTSWALTVRERRSGVSRAGGDPLVMSRRGLEAMLAEWRAWPLGAVVLVVRADRLTVSAGAGGAAPLHLVSAGGRLVASWDLMDLRSFVSSERLVGREVARILSGHSRYGHDTMFAGVHLLTVGSVADFSASGLELRYPAAVGRDQPRELAEDADPVAAFEELLAWVLEQRPMRADRVAVQLSGGQDSATVGLSLGALYPDAVTACAMELPSAAGVQQMERRALLAGACRLAGDCTVSALEYLPLHPAGARRGGRCSVYEEPYTELLEASLAAVVARGVVAVVTGFGGDELMAVAGQGSSRPARVRAWLGPAAREAEAERDAGIAPATAVPETALLALRTVSAPMLRAGVWPVAPLTDPHMVRFTRQLPEVWRADKALMRERLIRHGLPSRVVRPVLRETFAEVMATAVHRYAPALLRDMAADSPLVDAGFLDGRALLAVAEDCERGVRGAAEHSAVYTPIALDLAVRSLT